MSSGGVDRPSAQHGGPPSPGLVSGQDGGMPAPVESCVALLNGAGLDGPVDVVAVLDTDEQALALRVDDSSWFESWKVARELVPSTGRWPIAIADYDWPRSDPFSRSSFLETSSGLDVHPRAIIDRAPSFDLDGALVAEEERQANEWRPDSEAISADLDETRAMYGDAPTLNDVLSEVGPEPAQLDVERYLFAWESRLEPIDSWDDSYLEWWQPNEAALVLLPDAAPTSAFAYIGGFEWSWPHPDIRTAALLRWHTKFGVEPVANWGTMQQLVVPRPPTDPEVAMSLAREISLLWPDTAGGSNGVSTRRHARDLMGRDNWFLHRRP